MCFFKDSNGEHFVAVRWLKEVPGVIIDPITRLAPLTMSPPASTDSYSVLPSNAIQNGAVVLSAEGKLYPLMSPREDQTYRMSNYTNKGPNCLTYTRR